MEKYRNKLNLLEQENIKNDEKILTDFIDRNKDKFADDSNGIFDLLVNVRKLDLKSNKYKLK